MKLGNSNWSKEISGEKLIRRIPKDVRVKFWRWFLTTTDTTWEVDHVIWELRREEVKAQQEARQAAREALCAPYKPWQPGEPFRLVSPHEHVYEGVTGPVDPATPKVCIICGEASGVWDDVNVSIVMDAGETDMTIRELFGGEDHPVPLTIDAIVKEIESCGSKRTVLQDWDLIDGIAFTVEVRGLGSGDVWEPGWKKARASTSVQGAAS